MHALRMFVEFGAAGAAAGGGDFRQLQQQLLRDASPRVLLYSDDFVEQVNQLRLPGIEHYNLLFR